MRPKDNKPNLALIGACAALMGCSYAPVADVPKGTDPAAILQGCCAVVETYPPSLIAMIEPKADDKSTLGTPHRFRPPYLARYPEADALIMRHLRPLDILTTSDKGRLTGRLLPGYFTHSLVYLGTEVQLRAEGLWAHPALRPHHAKLRAGQVFFESVPDAVTFSDQSQVLDVDAVAILRPAISRVEKYAALGRLISQLGKPFDRRMDSRTQNCLYCAELIDFAFPTLNFPKSLAYKRPVLPPDGIARHALMTEHLDYIGFVYARPDRLVSAAPEVLAATLRKQAPGSRESRDYLP